MYAFDVRPCMLWVGLWVIQPRKYEGYLGCARCPLFPVDRHTYPSVDTVWHRTIFLPFQRRFRSAVGRVRIKGNNRKILNPYPSY